MIYVLSGLLAGIGKQLC